MLDKIIIYLKHYFHFFGAHSLNNELLIMTKEEERTTLTSSFACTQDSLDVLFYIQ
jgi:hypothetical protein